MVTCIVVEHAGGINTEGMQSTTRSWAGVLKIDFLTSGRDESYSIHRRFQCPLEFSEGSNPPILLCRLVWSMWLEIDFLTSGRGESPSRESLAFIKANNWGKHQRTEISSRC